MRRCEYKKRYNPSSGKHEYHHIYGGGILDPARWFAAKVAALATAKATKKAATKAAEKAATAALTKTGEYAGNRAGDKIIQMLQRGKKTPTQSVGVSPTHDQSGSPTLSQDEINQRVQRILNGGKIRKIKF